MKANIETLADAFRDFLLHVYPNGATPEQERQIENAFYGGALCCFGLVGKATDRSEEQAMQSLSQIHAELDNYPQKGPRESVRKN